MLRIFVLFYCQVGDANMDSFVLVLNMYLFIMLFVYWMRNDTCVFFCVWLMNDKVLCITSTCYVVLWITSTCYVVLCITSTCYVVLGITSTCYVVLCITSTCYVVLCITSTCYVVLCITSRVMLWKSCYACWYFALVV